MNKERNQQKTDILLTKDEQECFQTLVEIDSNWAQLFKENILSSRDKITARLMASIYRENLVGGFDHCEIKEAQHFKIVPFLLANYYAFILHILDEHYSQKSKDNMHSTAST